ncbi:hypothetical protein [Pseudomonas cremoricolorata]|uniref:hypothetical protein n=1 Tax=Pseudomonas cremoricolorata TaxID=157783 RepID=UPI0004037874|nr:hypothetical protein [Pseudomonas cremoricolorata]
MRALADFIMRGRVQATLVVVGCAALSLLFWLSAAAASLVFLRRGFKDASSVIGWALLPALAWWVFGDPRTLAVLAGTLGMAALLRAGHSWNRVLLSSIGLGLLYGIILGSVFREPIEALARALEQALPQMLDGLYQKMSVEERAQLGGIVVPVLTGLMAAGLQIISVLALMLGRYWQAALYNPGGFGREFQTVRFTLVPALVLLGCMLFGPSLGSGLALLTPLCSVPLMFAGVALLHGLVAQKRLSKFWLVGLYVTMVLFMQLTYPLLVVLAIVDSLIDFRGSKPPQQGDGAANGEG